LNSRPNRYNENKKKNGRTNGQGRSKTKGRGAPVDGKKPPRRCVGPSINRGNKMVGKEKSATRQRWLLNSRGKRAGESKRSGKWSTRIKGETKVPNGQNRDQKKIRTGSEKKSAANNGTTNLYKAIRPEAMEKVPQWKA